MISQWIRLSFFSLFPLFPHNQYHYSTFHRYDGNGWDVDGNHIEIDVDEIRHLSEKRCSEFFVTASKPGTCKLNCRLMCAEYVDPQFQELTVEVVKAGD